MTNKWEVYKEADGSKGLYKGKKSLLSWEAVCEKINSLEETLKFIQNPWDIDIDIPLTFESKLVRDKENEK